MNAAPGYGLCPPKFSLKEQFSFIYVLDIYLLGDFLAVAAPCMYCINVGMATMAANDIVRTGGRRWFRLHLVNTVSVVILVALLAEMAAGKGRLSSVNYSPRCCVTADCLPAAGARNYAVVTSLRSIDYMVSLRDLQCSLQRTNPQLPLIVLAVANELPSEIIAEVQLFAEYKEVPNIEYDNFNVHRYSKNWFKLNAWNITEFTSIVLLDADTVVLQSLNHVFELPTDFAWSFQNAPEYNWNKGGFIMLRPCQPVFEHMLSILEQDDTKHFTTEFAEQSFLSWYFEYTGYRLPMIYNANVNFLNASGATAGGADPIMVHFADNKLFNVNESHPFWHFMCHRYYKSSQHHSHIFVDPV